jgi:hypothetical protein
VWTNPVPGQSAEYQQWYGSSTFPRFSPFPDSLMRNGRAAPTQRTGAPPGEFGFLAVYGINGPLDAALGGLDAAGPGGMHSSTAMDRRYRSPVYSRLAEPGER